MIGRRVWLFVQLSRPLFLLGGAALYGLGLAIAVQVGTELDPWLTLAGQALVSTVQLTVHYSNEFFDQATDTANTSRTPFSGGSGALGPGRLAPRTALAGAFVSLIGALWASVALLDAGRLRGPALVIFAATLAVALAYSAPPFRLVSTGWGELLASIVVAGGVPAFGFSLATGRVDRILLAAVLPLVALHFAMVLSFSLPDEAADRSTGKRTLAVRLGARTTISLVRMGLAVAFACLAGFLALRALPATVALAGLSLPAAVALERLTRQAVVSGRPRWSLVTACAISLFALTAVLEAVGFLWSVYA